MSKIGLAGHSRGGQTALLAGESLVGKIQGVFGLDPVDTSRWRPEASTNIAAIGVPLAFIGETTDSTGILGMPCAPADVDFLVLYGDAASPAVAITALNADHTMFEDPADCRFCTLCTAGTASQPTYSRWRSAISRPSSRDSCWATRPSAPRSREQGSIRT